MGSGFGFVSADIKQKNDILQNLLNNDKENYKTVKKMISHEIDNNELHFGARTLLRLHRGLGKTICLIYLHFY